MCRYCFKEINISKRFLVTQHFDSTEQHRANQLRLEASSATFRPQTPLERFVSPESNVFNKELVTAFMAADIPLQKIENPNLKSFLRKFA